MMRADDCRQIIDFFFSGSEVPEDMEKGFRAWLALHGDDPLVVQELERQWNSADGLQDYKDIRECMSRLHRNLPGRRSLRSGILRYGAMAACAVLMFFAGYAVSGLAGNGVRETVLMASPENVGTYSLPDGTRVWLNRDSYLTYTDRFGGDERKVTLEGEAYFDVTKDSDRPFIVEMGNSLEVKVLGTSFNACSNEMENAVDVILKSGSLQIFDRHSDENVILMPDQRYVKNGMNTEVSHIDAGACCRWFEKKLIFDNVRLEDVLENISHRYRIGIQGNIGGLADKRMSMTISDEQLDEVMFVLNSLLPVECRLHEGKMIIDNKK